MFLHGIYPHRHSGAGKCCGEPLLCPRKRPPSLWHRADVACCAPFTATWVTLGMGRRGWHSATLYVLTRGGELKASCGFCLQPLAHDQECSSVVLPGGQPETLPGWHMLVGEERTEG